MFCWSRFGPEAGEPIHAILQRKERERRLTGGTFYWGIGNSVGPGLVKLLELCADPEVLFSPIKTRPRAIDVTPPGVVRWRAFRDLAGNDTRLPKSIAITSRAGDRPAAPHYALVCHTTTRLKLGQLGSVAFGELRNLSTGNRLGASQVTSIVQRIHREEDSGGSVYPVALRARLTPPYFVRLLNPEPITPAAAKRLDACAA